MLSALCQVNLCFQLSQLAKVRQQAGNILTGSNSRRKARADLSYGGGESHNLNHQNLLFKDYLAAIEITSLAGLSGFALHYLL
jgi:hypothetical protein